jgi:hypothetical protein
MGKGRVPMQVSPHFKDKLKEIQRKMILSGNEISLRDLTDQIADMDSLSSIQEKLMDKKLKDINLNLDKRRRR